MLAVTFYARLVITGAIAGLLAAEAARLTYTSAVANDNPRLATRLAPLSPDALVSTAMGQVGEAAAHGATVGPNVRGRLRLVSAAAPLQPEPFLVEAAI